MNYAALFAIKTSPLELMLRVTLMYWFLLVIRLDPRQGSGDGTHGVS